MPGWNYRLTDLQCGLVRSQLKKLPRFLQRRQEIAKAFDEAFADLGGVEPLVQQPATENAYHLYVIRMKQRDRVFQALNAEGIGVNVHYIPVVSHPLFREHQGECPNAQAAYEEILSLPIFPKMSAGDVEDVIAAVKKVASAQYAHALSRMSLGRDWPPLDTAGK